MRWNSSSDSGVPASQHQKFNFNLDLGCCLCRVCKILPVKICFPFCKDVRGGSLISHQKLSPVCNWVLEPGFVDQNVAGEIWNSYGISANECLLIGVNFLRLRGCTISAYHAKIKGWKFEVCHRGEDGIECWSDLWVWLIRVKAGNWRVSTT